MVLWHGSRLPPCSHSALISWEYRTTNLSVRCWFDSMPPSELGNVYTTVKAALTWALKSRNFSSGQDPEKPSQSTWCPCITFLNYPCESSKNEDLAQQNQSKITLLFHGVLQEDWASAGAISSTWRIFQREFLKNIILLKKVINPRVWWWKAALISQTFFGGFELHKSSFIVL